jgi:1-acyl-sn-glycerol-3-phosphate acyltransferase
VIPVPPKFVRRLLLAPVVVAVEVVLLLLSPLLLLVAVVVSPLFGGWRPARLSLVAVVAVERHVGALLACLALWAGSGFGWRLRSDAMQSAHYAVMRWFVAGIYRAIVRLARVEVSILGSAEAERILSMSGRPVVVLSRHAGEGETLLVVHQLLCRYRRGPRVVLHEALRLEPLIDVLGDRLPNRFVDPRGGDTEVEIAAMARELGETAALLIFPEGVNFSERSRRRGIERLERAGFHEEAESARAMRHVSAPRPGGTLAAIEAAPTADVVVMGHVGFPTGIGEVWHFLPEPQHIEVRLWHEPAGAIPSDREEQIDWLFGWWRTLDAWVDEREGRRSRAQPGETLSRGGRI